MASSTRAAYLLSPSRLTSPLRASRAVLFPATLGLGLVLTTSLGWAQTSDDALAESLFQDGKRLMDAGQLDAACPKLAESHRLAPAGGTAIAVGMCFEKAGKTASAWAAFTDALAIANRDRRTDRATFATARISELDVKLARVAITVPIKVRTLPNVTLTLDGRPLNKAAWDTRTPIDPGTHKITASADGHKTAEDEFTIKPAETLSVEAPIPVPGGASSSSPGAAPTATTSAAPAHPSAPGSATPAPPATSGDAAIIRPTLVPGLVVAGIGVAALAVGGGFGLSAIDKTKQANDACPTSRCGDANAVSLNDKAGTHATIATVLMPAGAAAMAVGTFLVLRTRPAVVSTTAEAKPKSTSITSISPSFSDHGSSLLVGGTF